MVPFLTPFIGGQLFTKQRGGIMNYTNNIRSIRTERNITQAELARAIDITARNLHNIENDQQSLSLSTAYRIAKYFNLMIQDVFPEK